MSDFSLNLMKEFTIGPNEAGQRFDKYLGKLLSETSMSFVYKMLRKKNFTLNGKKAAGNEILAAGDRVRLFLSDETFEKFSSKEGKRGGNGISPYAPSDLARVHLYPVYEDEHILIFNKPVGMLSQKAAEEDVSVNEYLIGYLLYEHKLAAEDLKTFKPSVANRLDRNTSGLIVCGKSLLGLQYLSEVIKNRTLEKYYRCLVEGNVAESFLLEGYLTKDTKKNKVAVTSKPIDGTDSSFIKTGIDPIGQYLWKGRNYTELSIHLITGKPHQIRAHLSSIGHPIIGDFKYGGGRKEGIGEKYHLKNQLLHAYKLVFPKTQGAFEYLSEKEITAALPPVYEKILKELQNGNME